MTNFIFEDPAVQATGTGNHWSQIRQAQRNAMEEHPGEWLLLTTRTTRQKAAQYKGSLARNHYPEFVGCEFLHAPRSDKTTGVYIRLPDTDTFDEAEAVEAFPVINTVSAQNDYA